MKLPPVAAASVALQSNVIITVTLWRVVGRAIRAGELGHVLVDVRPRLALDVLVDFEVLQMAAVFQFLVEHGVC